ncbi:Protein of unknown function [Propionibacterium freudenreichii]|nr:Protein of unknown function [Propionibacterium freudenreichii]CEI28051.1 Protein of unknown function [Propionibacterium freudenreichii]CEI31186.1 Protein of unknown function [Propionibacterium freudenreichii]CEI49903.1 Protein of unknown function [Propionibacterium freudenreichii]
MRGALRKDVRAGEYPVPPRHPEALHSQVMDIPR